MNRKILSALLALSLAACGGGGGGGGDNSPSRSNVSPNPDGNPQQNLQTGVFTDAPVSGLRYRQGTVEGVTDSEGRFAYNANDSAKVEFLIGHASIGYATGAQAVTPFDLQTEQGSLNYNRGINVSRLLISLDVDSNPGNGIALPSDINDFAGNLPFDLLPTEFTQDAQVARVLTVFNVPHLVGENDALTHIADNDIIVQKLDDAVALLEALGDVHVRWNPNLDSAGVLADIEASNSERMLILVDGSSPLYLSGVLYFDAQGHYTLLGYSPNGGLHSANINGAIIKSLTVNNFQGIADRAQARDLANYTLPANRVLVDTRSNTLTLIKSHASIGQLLASTLHKLVESSVDDNDILNLASTLMQDVKKTTCNTNPNCTAHSFMAYGLQQSLADSQYFDDRFTLSQLGSDTLSLSSLCLATTVINDGTICNSGVSLENFLQNLTANTGAALTAWEASHIVPWANGELTATFTVTDAKNRGLGYPSGIPLDSPDVYPPWFKSEAKLDFHFQVFRLNKHLHFAEAKLLRASSPLAFQDCAYQQRPNRSNLEPICSAPSTNVNSSERQAVVDAMSDVIALTRSFSVLLFNPEANPTFFNSTSLMFIREGIFDANRPSTSGLQFEYEPQQEMQLGRLLTTGLDTYYDYSISEDTSDFLNLIFNVNIGIRYDYKDFGLGFIGRLIDPRFRQGFAYITLNAQSLPANQN